MASASASQALACDGGAGSPAPARASGGDAASACAPSASTCAPEPFESGASPAAAVDGGPGATSEVAPSASSATAAPADSARADERAEILLFLWGRGCPRCAEAEPLLAALEREGVRVERVEVRADPEGRRRYGALVGRLGVQGAGIPLFVRGDRFVVGYRAGATDREVRALLAARPDVGARALRLPLLGEVDPRRSWLFFTVAVALVDSLNPCAMYVLVALLGILLHVRSRDRLALLGATFVVVSGVVYFLFMAAWLGFFLVAGLTRALTTALGVALCAMGLVNLKELVWFRRGPSLAIPDRAKPGLFRRMRAIAAASSVPVALLGIAGLAFVVNLVELGCTLGLPAAYTRLLAARGGARWPWLALYNVLYVLPLAAVVLVFARVRRRLSFGPRAARGLKALSGALLLAFGSAFILWPDALR